MRYWDSSALVPLIVEQSATSRMRRIAMEDSAVVTWWASSVECASALARLARGESLTREAHAKGIAHLRAAMTMWTELSPSRDVREQAMRMVRVHPLRAADALHLAAALVASDFDASSLEFVTLDTRQAEAAEAEGFRVVA